MFRGCMPPSAISMKGFTRRSCRQYTWWVAAYRSVRPELAKDAWQYISTYTGFPGVSGKVDRDYFYREFAPVDGWVETEKGWYWYEKGQPVKAAWRKITGASGVAYWYYLSEDGVMLTGMQRIGRKVYYLNPSAALGVPEGGAAFRQMKMGLCIGGKGEDGGGEPRRLLVFVRKVYEYRLK